jgi:polyisoprenyl-teichoic acid--peptidoglycan teichoic acid transferase
MPESLPRGSFLRYMTVLLSILAFAGCVPVAPVMAPVRGTGSGQKQAELANDKEADHATGGTSLLPAWRNTENILILGADQDVNSGNWRTDAVMVLGIDRIGRRAALLSVPRDLYVEISNHGGERINTVDSMGEHSVEIDGGGPALVAQVLEQTLGLRIDHWIRIEINNVREFVDRLGGITVHLDCPFYEPVINLNAGQWEYLTLPAGDVRMDGETVYWFVRLRLMEGDVGRTNRQRQLLLALREKVISAKLLQNLPQLIDEFRSMFSSDMTLAELVDIGRVGLSIPADDIHSGHLNDSGLQRFQTPLGITVFRIVDPMLVRETVNELWNSPLPNVGKNQRSAQCTRPSLELLRSLTQKYAADQTQ